MELLRTFTLSTFEEQLALVRKIREARAARKLPQLKLDGGKSRRSSSTMLGITKKIITPQFRALPREEQVAHLRKLLENLED